MGGLGGKNVNEYFQICNLSNSSGTQAIYFLFLWETDLAKLWKNITKFLKVNKHQQKLRLKILTTAAIEAQVNVKNITYKYSNSEIPICFQFYYDSTFKLHLKLALLVLETTHMPTQYQSVCLENCTYQLR